MFFCPVEAAKKFMAISGNFPGSLPLLRTETALLTREKLNSVLKSTLDSVVEYGAIRTHSFRAGLTTALARAGVSDDVGSTAPSVNTGGAGLQNLSDG